MNAQYARQLAEQRKVALYIAAIDRMIALGAKLKEISTLYSVRDLTAEERDELVTYYESQGFTAVLESWEHFGDRTLRLYWSE